MENIETSNLSGRHTLVEKDPETKTGKAYVALYSWPPKPSLIESCNQKCMFLAAANFFAEVLVLKYMKTFMMRETP